MSLAICRSKIGEISFPEWNGIVVPRPFGMPKLLVQNTLTTFFKAKLYKDRNNFLRFEDWKIAHFMPP